MLMTSVVAFGYVKVSVTRDFALLAGGMTRKQSRNASLSSSQSSTDPEGRSIIGGLEIESDATEHVGW